MPTTIQISKLNLVRGINLIINPILPTPTPTPDPLLAYTASKLPLLNSNYLNAFAASARYASSARPELIIDILAQAFAAYDFKPEYQSINADGSGGIPEVGQPVGHQKTFVGTVNATQTGSNRPVRNAAGIQFDGIDDFLAIISSTFSRNVRGTTSIAILNYGKTAGGETAFYASTGIASPLSARFSIQGNSTNLYQFAGRKTDAGSALSITGGTKTIQPIVQTAVANYQGAEALLRVNGQQLNSGTIETYASATGTATFVSAQNYPDASGNETIPGTGFTCTGLALDPSDNTWWVGNVGRVREDIPQTTQPSLVQTSFDGATKLNEILLRPLFPAIGSVQGVVVDPNGSLWFASQTEGLIRNISKAGEPLGSIPFTACNGLAYDPNDDTFYCADSTNLNIRKINKTGAVIKTFPVTSQPDHIYLDESKDLIWYSTGANKTPGQIYGIDRYSGKEVVIYTMNALDAIEGIVIIGNTLYAANDAYFHIGNPPLNRFVVHTLSAFSTSNTSTNTQSQWIGIGSNPALSAAFQGVFRGLLLFNKVLSSNDLLLIERFCNHFYSLGLGESL